MSKIHIGKSVYCDLSTLINTRLLIQANSGGGKSWLLRRLLEQSHGKVQQIVIDLEGEFSTLREKYDYILCGKDGDIQTDIRYAKVLARKILELNISAIIDLYELKHHARKHFVKVFLDALINAPKKLWHPCLVIVDEAHIFAPQTGQSEATEAVIDLMTRGRKRGYCGILATQRISKLHKDACAESNNKLIGRTGLDIDMKRAGDELGFRTKDQQLELRDMDPGEFFAFGPALSRGVVKLKVGPVETTHPKAGARIGLVSTPPTGKIQRVLKQLTDLPQEAEHEARTIDDFKRQNIQLRRQITQMEKTKPEPSRDQIDVAVRRAVAEKDKEQDANLRKYKKYADELFTVIKKINQASSNALDEFNVGPNIIREVKSDKPTKPGTITFTSNEAPKHEYGGHTKPPRLRFKPKESSWTDDEKPLVAGALRMLRVLVSRYPMVLTRSQLAMFAKLSPRSGTFSNYLSMLRTRNFITEQSGGFQATDTGIDSLGETPSPPQTSEEVIALWQGVLGENNGSRRMFDALIEIYPDSLSREGLGDAINMSYSSGSFGNYLSMLRRNGLIDISNGMIKASENLYI